MKEKKNVLKLILGTAISIVMLFCFALQVPVYAAETEEETELYLEEIIDLGTVETSAVPSGMFSLRDGNVDLIDGTAVEWIGRLDLSGEEQVIRDFYDSLVEGSDNDGENDYLIQDSYYVNETSYVEAVTIDSDGTYATKDEAKTAASAAFQNCAKYIRAAVDAFDRDHPEVFWLSGITQCSCILSTSGSESSGYTYTIEVVFILKNVEGDFDVRATDYPSENEIKAAISAVDAKVKELTDAVKDKPVVDKIKYFNDWLTKNNQYNTSKELNAIDHDCRACTGALFEKTGTEGPVCEAYARAFKVLCDAVKIPCVLVDGTAVTDEDSGAHMWNYVQVGNNWYGVDVTWNDPTVENSSGAVSGAEREDYLLVGSDTVISERTFIESHPVENRVSVNGVSFTKGPELATSAFEGCTEHSGGVATCAAQAVCGICGESYGELGSHTLYGNGFCTECDGYEEARQVSSEHHPELNATHNGYYAIENAGQLYWFAEYVNDGNTSANAVLTADIVVNSGIFSTDGDGNLLYDGKAIDETNKPRVWMPIGKASFQDGYNGIFDGGEHTVNGLYCDNTSGSDVGLFGYVDKAGHLKNIGLTNSSVSGGGNSGRVGGICGYSGGTVENCYNTGSVSGTGSVGGVCGVGNGTVTGCHNTGSVSGTGYVGGVCGYSTGIVENCYNTGSVGSNVSSDNIFTGGVCGDFRGSAMTNCYNTGSVSGAQTTGNYTGSYTGGVCGENSSGIVTNCYNTGSVESAGKYTGGVCGYSAGIVENCYNTRSVENAGKYTGGVCGYVQTSGKVVSCYNTGSVSATGSYIGGVCGYCGSGCVTNCYYLDTAATGGINGGDSVGNAEAKTATRFASGEVAYLLNGTVTEGIWSAGATDGTQSWYQTLSGNSADVYPVFDSEHGTVYQTLACDGTTLVGYSNVNENEPHEDADSDGYCDKCYKVSNGIGVNLAGHSVSLGGQIGMNFYMDLDDSVLKDESAYMLFTFADNSTQNVMVKDVKTSPVTINEKTYYVFTCKVDAREMADTVKAKMVCKDGTKEGTEYTYSVKQYAEKLIKNGATDEEAALVKAMLNYGAYAQEYFGYNTNQLANNGQMDDVTEGFAQAKKATLTACKPVVTGNNAAFAYAGSTLILEADIKVRHYFKLTNETALDSLNGLTLYTAQQGNPVEGTYYYYESAGITAAALGDMSTPYTGVEGISISYCPLSYVTTVLANNNQELTDDTALQNLMKALYLYYQAVTNYNAV